MRAASCLLAVLAACAVWSLSAAEPAPGQEGSSCHGYTGENEVASTACGAGLSCVRPPLAPDDLPGTCKRVCAADSDCKKQNKVCCPGDAGSVCETKKLCDALASFLVPSPAKYMLRAGDQ